VWDWGNKRYCKIWVIEVPPHGLAPFGHRTEFGSFGSKGYIYGCVKKKRRKMKQKKIITTVQHQRPVTQAN